MGLRLKEGRKQGSRQPDSSLHWLLPPPEHGSSPGITSLASSRPLLKGQLLGEAFPDHYLNTLPAQAFLFALAMIYFFLLYLYTFFVHAFHQHPPLARELNEDGDFVHSGNLLTQLGTQ